MKDQGKLFSVVIVAWNSAAYLTECLDSVFRQKDIPMEVVVVDNGSTDRTPEILAALKDRAALIRFRENQGYCRACNAGLEKTKGAYVIFLNADTILEPDYLAVMAGVFEKDDQVGLAGGKLLRFDGHTLDSCGQMLSRGRKVIDRGYGRPDRGKYEEEETVFSICGAALACRRELIAQLRTEGSLFDEDFHSFYEDLDVGWRAGRCGWKAFYTPFARARHFRGSSESRKKGFWTRLGRTARRDRALKVHIMKNRYLVMLKNDTPDAVLKNLPFILAREIMLWGFYLLSSPSLVTDLWRSRKFMRKALEKRRALNLHKGDL